MSRIGDLIDELAPDGVRFMALGEVLRIRNGRDHKALGDGDIPVYGSGGIMRYADAAAAEGPSVLIPRKGSLGNIFYVEGPFWVVDTIFRTEINTDLIEPKFLYHQILTMGLSEMNQAGGVPSQTQTVLNSLRIPVPPLEVQRGIVRVLDQFTQLEAELEAELEARRVQRDYYRAHLFEPRETVQTYPLRSFCEFRRGTAITERTAIPGPFPVVANGPESTYRHDRSNRSGGTIVVARSGAYAGLVSYWNEPIFLTDAFSVHPDNSRASQRYVFHALQAFQAKLHGMKKGAGVPHVRVREVEEYAVPVPSLEEQERVAAILDRFDTLVGDISIGLPAELRARRKQYEHYRDRLLTFEELAS